MNHPESIFIALAGLFAMACSYMDFNFFMDNYKTRFLVSLIGRNRARAFYFILGLFLLVASISIWL